MINSGFRRKTKGLISNLTTGASDIYTVVRSAASVMTIRILGAGLAYALQVLLARWLGAFEFGIYAYAWVWVSLLSTLTPLGLNGSVLRFIPEYLSKQQWGLARGFFNFSRWAVFVSATCAVVIGTVSIFTGSEFIPNYYIYPLYIALFCVPFYALNGHYEGIARSFGWVNLAYSPNYVVRPSIFLLAMALLFYSNVPLDGMTALLIALGSVVLALSGQIIILKHRLPETVGKARPIYQSSYWMRSSLPFMMIMAFQIILSDTDMILLGFFVKPDELAIYFASIRTAGLVAFISFAISALAVPKFSSLYAKGAQQELQTFVSAIVHWIFWPALAFAVVLFIFGKSILGLFGPSFPTGFSVLVLLILGHLLKAATGPIDQLLNMTGNQGATAIVLACCSVLNIALNLVLIPYLGLIGAAIATTSSILVSTVWMVVLVQRRLGLNVLIFSTKIRIS